MADIRKTFNFRAGVQVDDDVFIVRGEQVGIGTTIPTQSLDVRGNAKVVGILTAQNTDFSAGISTFGDVKIGTGITISASSGIITATSFSGDGSQLQNVPTSSWTQYNQLDDNGLSVVSIAKSTGNVGIATTGASSNNDLQIGSDPQDGFSKGVGIGSDGNIYASGIITATTFRGTLVGTVATVKSVQGNFSDHVSVGDTVSIGGTVGLGSHVSFGDNSRAIFGISTSLIITSSRVNPTLPGGNFIINDTGTGNLVIGGSVIEFKNSELSQTQAEFFEGQQVNLYHANQKKFETTSSGVNITGITTTDDLRVTGVTTLGVTTTSTGSNFGFGNHALFKDEKFLFMGDDNALVIGHHAGPGHSQIKHDSDAQDLVLASDRIRFVSRAENKLLAAFYDGSRAFLNFDGNEKFSTSGVGVTITGEADVNGDLNVSGVSTFTGAIDANGDLDVSGIVGIGSNLNVTGVSTFAGVVTVNLGIQPDVNQGAYLGAPGSAWSSATIGEVKIASGSNNGEIDTTAGNLTLDSAGGTTIIDDNLSVTGVSTFTGNIDANGNLDVNGLLGIQTASPQTQLHVWDNAAQVARFQSNQTTSVISFVDETSTITPYIGANSNDLILGSVSGGERLRITGIGGSLGIGQTNPEQTLHVVGTSTVTSNAFFGGTVSIRGNTTINANLEVNSLTVPSLNAHIIGNNAKIHSTSGISTVAAFKATGISTFFDSVTITDGNTFQVNDGSKRFFISGLGAVGIRTSIGEDDVTIAGDTLFKTSVSVGNTARCAVDFSEVVNVVYNDGTDRAKAAYMLPPIVTTAQRNALVDGRLPGPVSPINGAIVFNSDAGRLEIRQGNNWYGIGTVA